jgi:hypothetical protein
MALIAAFGPDVCNTALHRLTDTYSGLHLHVHVAFEFEFLYLFYMCISIFAPAFLAAAEGLSSREPL